jgi:hypothetical protein
MLVLGGVQALPTSAAPSLRKRRHCALLPPSATASAIPLPLAIPINVPLPLGPHRPSAWSVPARRFTPTFPTLRSAHPAYRFTVRQEAQCASDAGVSLPGHEVQPPEVALRCVAWAQDTASSRDPALEDNSTTTPQPEDAPRERDLVEDVAAMDEDLARATIVSNPAPG